MIGLLAMAAMACGDQEQELNGAPEDGGECVGPSQGEWQVVMEDVEEGAMMSAWGPSKEEVYVVGGQPEEGHVWRWSKGQWQSFEVGQGPMLNWVHGVDGQIFMVGNQGRALRIVDGEVEALETGVDVDLWGVWAATPEQVWAVGGDARDFEGQPVMLYFDGVQWEPIEVPELDREANALFKIWGTGADHLFAVGALGVILYYDGQSWAQVSTGTADDFVSLWGRSDEEIVAVGGRSNGVVARWNGEGFEAEVLPGVPGLNGVWVDCTGQAHINGIDGYAGRAEGNGWQVQRESTPTTTVLHASFGVDDGPRFAVGGSLLSSPPYRGVLLMAGQ